MHHQNPEMKVVPAFITTNNNRTVQPETLPAIWRFIHALFYIYFLRLYINTVLILAQLSII